MAREESDREDLLREATAYGRRAEFRIVGGEHATVFFVGLRESGCSLYVGQDPVYHLDAGDRLRRAYVGGELYRTQGETLARLRRERTESTTDLLRTDLNEDELTDFRAEAAREIRRVLGAIGDDAVVVEGRVPKEDERILADAAERFARHLDEGQPLAPAIKGRK